MGRRRRRAGFWTNSLISLVIIERQLFGYSVAGISPWQIETVGVLGNVVLLWLEHKRLCPFLPELVTVLRRHGDSTIAAEIEAQLCQTSPSTIDRRYRSSPMIVTANRSPKDWYPLFPNPVIAESALDRLISCSHVITLTGKSYRALLRPDKALEKEVVTV